MKKNIALWLMALVVLWLGYMLINKSKGTQDDEKLFPIKTDTVYINKPFKPGGSLDKPVNPTIVYVYKTDTVKIESIRVVRDTVKIITELRDTVYYGENFLTQYPKSSKLIQFDLTNKKLELDLLSPEGIIKEEVYNIDPNKYAYRYVNNNLTAKSVKNRLKIGVQATYMIRPLVNYHDLNVNIVLKTGNFNYIGGISTYYYPTLKSSVGVTPILGITYNF